MSKKLTREPLIPLGCVLTVAAFTASYRAMRRGDHNQVQRMFRARILAQAFTVGVMVVGGIYLGADRQKEREGWKHSRAEQEAEKQRNWIRELEIRDEEEKALQDHLEKRRKRAAERAAKQTEGAVVEASKKALEEAKAEGGSAWAGWFGGKRDEEGKEPKTEGESPEKK